MIVDSQWHTTHRGLSDLDLRFREIAKNSPEYLDRDNFRSLDQDSKLLHYRLQPWPTFLGVRKLDELKRVSVGVHRLLRDVPARVFKNDPVKLASFYGLASPAIAEVLFLPPTGAETMITRGDFIETASGFKCIEFNFTPNLGGWDTSIIANLQLAASPTARFIASEGLEVAFTDTMFEIFRHIVEDVRNKGILQGGAVTIALLSGSEDIPELEQGLGYFNRKLQQTIMELGLSLRGLVVASSYERLVVRGGGIYLGNQRIDALVELSGDLIPPAVYRLFKGDRVGLYNGPLSSLLSSKRNVALLSQHAASGAYSREERSFIERHVPWTRLVVPGPIEHGGEEHSLVELLVSRRERWVLKDADSCGGKGVLLGRFASAEKWRQTIDQALAAGNWVVQEIQESLPYLYQSGEYGCSVHDMIWGPFVIGGRYGGVVLRMQPQADGGPVNLSLTATEGVVFEV